jgi:hypothetical protein
MVALKRFLARRFSMVVLPTEFLMVAHNSSNPMELL